MEANVYTIRLNEQQKRNVESLFAERGWRLELDTIERYKEKEGVAGEYVDLGVINERKSASAVLEASPRLPPRRRVHSEPTIQIQESEQAVQRLKEIKTIGTTYKKSYKKDAKTGTLTRGLKLEDVSETQNGGHSKEGKNWHVTSASGGPNSPEVEVDTSDITFQHFMVADDKTIKVITKLSTEHVHSISRVPVRIVLLVDRSGSMLHKIGRDSRHAKITKVKQFAKELVTSLDEGDEAGLVTFGEDAEVFFPLEKINEKSRPLLQRRLDSLDKGSMSRTTNLSAGLRMALKVFFDASHSEADYLETKNSILVFSDGEVNAGTTDTNSLLHEVRQNIRQMLPTIDDSQNQWVTISVVTTGSNISEQAYMLSKTCSSDAYYYIDKDAEDPEADLFVPVLLRKTAVAWNISYVVEVLQGIQFDDGKCSKDNRVRLRRSMSGRGARSEKAYFMYDFAAGHCRQIGVAAKWRGESSLEHLEDDAVLFKLRVEFTNIKGDRLWQEQLVTKEDVIDALHGRPDSEANAAACKHEVQMVSGDVLRFAAEHMLVGEKGKSKAVILDGQKNLEAILNQFGEQSRQDETDNKNSRALKVYARSVVDNLGALLETIEQSTEGESWNRMKAVSTAIVRQTPNVSNTVVDSQVLCPLPEVDEMGTKAMSDPLHRLMAKNKNKAQKRMSVGVEKLLEEFKF